MKLETKKTHEEFAKRISFTSGAPVKVALPEVCTQTLTNCATKEIQERVDGMLEVKKQNTFERGT